jgi:hypothetical protein
MRKPQSRPAHRRLKRESTAKLHCAIHRSCALTAERVAAGRAFRHGLQTAHAIYEPRLGRVREDVDEAPSPRMP